MNFASGGKVTIKLKKNEVGGPLDVIGGLSRPDAVVDATTTIDSHGNLYSRHQEAMPRRGKSSVEVARR